MEQFIITTIYIKNLKPKATTYDISIGNNLYLRVHPSGTKSWRVIMKSKGKRLISSLGIFPEVSLSEAKKLASTSQQSLIEKFSSASFSEVFTAWLELKTTKVKNIKDTRNRLNRAFISYFKDTPINTIKPMDVIKRLNELYGKDDKLETIKRCCNIMAQLERYAHTLGYVKSLQMQNLGEVFKTPRATHMPSVHPNQLKNIIDTLKPEMQISKNVFSLLLLALYTLTRPSEYTSLEWDWIDFKEKVITIPAEKMKMKREFRVPISRQLEQILMLLKQQRINDFVFPSTVKSGHIGIDTFAKFLRIHGFKDVLVPHGIRSIGRTWFAENGIDYSVAELCLAHEVDSKVSQAYNRSDLLEERREAMQRWCDFVESCLNNA